MSMLMPTARPLKEKSENKQHTSKMQHYITLADVALRDGKVKSK
jgi:hypothetical protein